MRSLSTLLIAARGLATGPGAPAKEAWQPVFEQLKRLLAPTAAVSAARGPVARGLFATRHLPRGSVIVSTDTANVLYGGSNQPGSSVATRQALQRWQKQHGPLPPPLERFLSEGQSSVAAAVSEPRGSPSEVPRCPMCGSL